MASDVEKQSDEYLAALDSLHAFVGGRNDHPLYREFLRFVDTAHPPAAEVREVGEFSHRVVDAFAVIGRWAGPELSAALKAALSPPGRD